jgi:hypothetical protein
VSVSPYSDVPASHWAAAYIAKAKELGIVGGYSDGTFKLNANATRSEALKMILLTWVSAETISTAPASTSCSDVVQSEWYAKYFNYALNHSVCTLGTLRAVLEVSVRYEFFEKGILRKQGNSIQFPFLGSQKIKKPREANT